MQRQNINTKGLTIIPEETLEFIVDKKSQTSESKILIYNSSNIDVAYKIKSSSPKDFTFLKSEGLVSSNSKLVITIVYSFSEQSYYKFHKFLLQTANIKNEQLSYLRRSRARQVFSRLQGMKLRFKLLINLKMTLRISYAFIRGGRKRLLIMLLSSLWKRTEGRRF